MGRRILVVEDNEQNLYLVTRLLEKRGHQVIPARDGREAIELASHARPALILMDIQLPMMDGYADARQLRSNREFDHIPIVAVTSYAMAGDRERVLAAGCNGYIEKPIDPYSFVDEVARYLPDSDADKDNV
jgi:two-component system cell cycle response regulator DivK